MGDEDEIPDFRLGKCICNCKEFDKESSGKMRMEQMVIQGQWKIMEKIGAGGCGAVYEVTHVKRKNFAAALKKKRKVLGNELKRHKFSINKVIKCGVGSSMVESTALPDGGVLKLEAYVLGKLSSATKNTIRLLHSGKRPKYSFIVMTLCGPDLTFLRKMKGINRIKRDDDHFSFETTLRIAVQCLFAIKMLHEIGFVHRDVKPGNMVIGINGRDCRTIFMIDYGNLCFIHSFIHSFK
uniref:non-specific serine/threonine protein kinase n=1 Tax=Wuchereria bancrofti TaxID=6293 RepID=A0A1I8ELW9_WUCBA